MTLKDIANAVKDILDCEYVTAEPDKPDYMVAIWKGGRPAWAGDRWWHAGRASMVVGIDSYDLIGDLNLSEFMDDKGKIDFLKAIVRVER